MSVKGRKPRRFLNVDVFLLSLTKAFFVFSALRRTNRLFHLELLNNSGAGFGTGYVPPRLG